MIGALQYYQNEDDGKGDLPQTMSLARLVADLLPEMRNDVLLALVSQPGTPRTPLVERTVAHCRRKLPVVEIVSEIGARGHPEGCTTLWLGTTSHFYRMLKAGHHFDPACIYDSTTPHGRSLLALDGGDGIPLHRNWLDLLIELHLETLSKGKLITGTPYFQGGCPLHVNPNAVFELSVFGQTNFLTDIPQYDGSVMTNFDVYHREEMLRHASLSSAVRTDWRGGGRRATRELLLERSREAIWLHGYRDADLYFTAREHLASRPAPPQIKHYDLAHLRTSERVQRDYEEACRFEETAMKERPR